VSSGSDMACLEFNAACSKYSLGVTTLEDT
jgi:hypothetical protein